MNDDRVSDYQCFSMSRDVLMKMSLDSVEAHFDKCHEMMLFFTHYWSDVYERLQELRDEAQKEKKICVDER